MEDKNIVEFELLEHQAGAVNKFNGEYSIDVNTGNIKKSEGIYDKHNVAGGVEPTGTGKSFIALAQMIAVNNANYKGITQSIDEEGYERYHINIPKNSDGSVNRSKIVYVAPTNEIAEQIKIDIVKYIANINPDNLSTSERDKIVYELFPNLSFKCYATLASGARNHDEGTKDGYDPYEDNPDLVILDEVHRSGAMTWQKGTAALLGCKVENGKVIQDKNANPQKKNIKVLSISATPERDVDGIDMTKVWASAIGGYTEEELSDDVRADLGIKMTLPEAINKGILRNPDVVYFDCNLGETDDYRYLVRVANNQDIDVRISNEAKEAIKKINDDVIGIPNYDKLNQEQREKAREEKEIEILTQAIMDGKFNIHGKFILFAPKDTVKNNPNGVKPFLEYHAEKTTRILREALKRAGIENTIDVKYISSEKSDKENADVLSEFDSKDVTEGPIQIVVAQEKFNEGVHAKNISGGFNTRSIMEQENTQLRAQSILFLQQKGRFDAALIPGKTPPPIPTIFDRCNNFYTQNINGAIDEEQRIPIFELTETQKILHDAFRHIRSIVPEKDDITTRLPRLIEITRVLTSNGIKINSKEISDNEKLSRLLERPEYFEVKDKIYEQLEEEGLIQKNANGKGYKEYRLGANLKFCRKSFWSGTKAFDKDNITMEQLIIAGIIDETSSEYQKAIDKKWVDENGFIVMGASEGFIGMNIKTGTRYSLEGKDIDGFEEGQFDNETGLDTDGYDRRGFNVDGVHKDTGTIHDNHGFMKDGTNILTGTNLDLGGYTEEGIKPFKNEEWEDENGKEHGGDIVGGFDREHRFHPYNEKTEKFDKTPTGYYAPYGRPGCKEYKNIDEFGFDSKTKRNLHNFGSKINLYGFEKVGDKYVCYRDGNIPMSTNKMGRDVSGNDCFGFNYKGIHKDTGTRLDLKGRSYKFYSNEAEQINEKLSNFRSDVYTLSKGKIINKKTGKPCIRVMGFDASGINKITGYYKDQYGFTFVDYFSSNKYVRSNNIYGFSADDVKKISMSTDPNILYKSYKGVKVNILGTDKFGRVYDSKTRKIGNDLHPSLKVAKEYIEKVVNEGMDQKKFYEEYAVSHKLLTVEAKYEVLTALNQAVTLYRICPELSRSQEAKDVIKLLSNSKEENIDKFFENIIGGRTILKNETNKMNKVLEDIEKTISQERNPEKLKELTIRKEMLTRRITELKQIPEKS